MRGVTESVYGEASSRRVVFRTLGGQARNPKPSLIPNLFAEIYSGTLITTRMCNDVMGSLPRNDQRGQRMQRSKRGDPREFRNRGGVYDRRVDASGKMIYKRRNERCFKLIAVPQHVAVGLS